jgi:hypothetical protein
LDFVYRAVFRQRSIRFVLVELKVTKANPEERTLDDCATAIAIPLSLCRTAVLSYLRHPEMFEELVQPEDLSHRENEENPTSMGNHEHHRQLLDLFCNEPVPQWVEPAQEATWQAAFSLSGRPRWSPSRMTIEKNNSWGRPVHPRVFPPTPLSLL